MRDGKGTVTCQNSQKGVGNDRLHFTANNERAVQTFKAFFCTKKCLERIPRDIYIYFYKNLLVNLPTGSPSSSNHCRCTVAYSAILPTILGFLSVQKKNQEIMIFTSKNKTYYMWIFRSRNFRETKESKVI